LISIIAGSWEIAEKVNDKDMSEAQIQAACVTWLWNTYPQTRGLFFAVNNNSEHVARAMNRKAVGLVAGVSDTIFLWRGKALLIEFKTPTGKQSAKQQEWQERAEAQGFRYYIVRSLEDFQELIRGLI